MDMVQAPTSFSIRPGETGEIVEEMQRKLRDGGYDVVPTAVYDETTTHAVRQLQGLSGLNATGVVDGVTYSRILQLAAGSGAKGPSPTDTKATSSVADKAEAKLTAKGGRDITTELKERVAKLRIVKGEEAATKKAKVDAERAATTKTPPAERRTTTTNTSDSSGSGSSDYSGGGGSGGGQSNYDLPPPTSETPPATDLALPQPGTPPVSETSPIVKGLLLVSVIAAAAWLYDQRWRGAPVSDDEE